MMQPGDFFLWIAMVGTLCSAIVYVSAAMGRRKLISLARAFYAAMVTAVFGASLNLMALIWQGRFDIFYVYSYTSRNLEPIYKVSAFWAGQEGSFLLWALFGAVLGLFIIRKSARDRAFEPWLMSFWSVLQAFLLILLLVKSPFVLTLDQVPAANLSDGAGLNPLLQNPWMAIHPPLIFLGYAAMAVPAGFVISALIRREYDSWAMESLPWAIFAWVTLGAGIFVGGYWAYEVLGWGGYWAWDPVENASLVPWLTGTALLHGLIVERNRGTLRRTNMVLALVSFILIIYATFLTRSGVLGDFSVHSFSELGVNGYLIAFIAFFMVLSAGLYLWRAKEIPGGPAFSSVKSKEFTLFLTVIVLLVSALLILFGTSSPIYTKWMGNPQSVDADFYVRTNTPVAIILLVLMALAPVLSWSRSNPKSNRALKWMVSALVLSMLAAIIIGMLVAFRGTPQRAIPTGAALAVGLSAIVALVANLSKMIRRSRLNIQSAGGFLAHTGIALMFIGILLSSRGGESEKLFLAYNGEAKKSHGYSFKYVGKEQLSATKEALKIQVSGRGVDYMARPTLQPARDGTMRSPAIRKTIANDLYIAPVQDSGAIQLVLVQGSPTKLHGIDYEFIRFVMGGAHTVDSLEVGAEIKVAKDGEESFVTPRIIVRGQNRSSPNIDVPGTDIKLSLVQMSVEDRAVQIDVSPQTESVVIEVSEKPWISLLWLGAVLTLVGGVIAMRRRFRENSRAYMRDINQKFEEEKTASANV